MASTLLLDTQQWDLVPDAAGNIAMASEPYSSAQDAASNIRTFQGEQYYNTSAGVPYFGQILGQNPPVPLMKAQFNAAAQQVPDVTSSQAYITSVSDRTVTGQVQVTSAVTGTTSAVNFATPTGTQTGGGGTAAPPPVTQASPVYLVDDTGAQIVDDLNNPIVVNE